MRQLSHTEDRTLDIEQHAYNLLSQRVDLLAVLQEVDVELNHTLELDSVVRVAISAAQVLSQASSGCIILIEGGALMVFAAFGGYTGVSSLPADGIIMRALRLERSEYLLDVTQDDDYCPTIPETRAQIAIPMLAHHRIVGLLNVETETPEYFTPEVFEAIVLLASRIASAVENARLYRTSQEQLAELHKLYADLTGLEQLKSDLIRITAHDLRSPLSIIYGYTDLLQNELHDHLTEQQIEYFQKVRQAIGRIKRMSTDILALERLQEDKALPQEIVSLGGLLQTVVDEFLEESRQRDQQITLVLADETVYVTGDQAQLGEAIANLLSNAIHYTPNGGRISARVINQATCVSIEIQDNGYGIPDSDQARLFEPFFRVKTKETRGIAGTGLGLYLVKRIVERHGGQVAFRSVYGFGSTFGFCIPRMT